MKTSFDLLLTLHLIIHILIMVIPIYYTVVIEDNNKHQS